jgi:hypothetical protein
MNALPQFGPHDRTQAPTYTEDSMKDALRKAAAEALAVPPGAAYPLAAQPAATPAPTTLVESFAAYLLTRAAECPDMTVDAMLREIGYVDAQPAAEPVHCRTDGRCQYAIDHGAEGMGHCPPGKCCMPDALAAVAWRDHVEQRIRTWRQRLMNREGDRLALDDLMSAESVDDLVDFVCDEYTHPAQPVVQAPHNSQHEIWVAAMNKLIDERDELLAKLAAQPVVQAPLLTDDEIDDLARTMVKGGMSVNWLARSIEARIRSKT